MRGKCCKCKRESTRGWLQGNGTTIWFCTFHYNRMIQDARMHRRLERARNR